jgi:uncharacterized membrane protein
VPAHDETEATAQIAKKRWAALDLFRFTAVVLMVQGHVFNVLVEESIRPEKWYRWHNYVHGYTAPMFMFASGLAFGITTFRRWDEHATLGRPVWKRLERYVLIVGIGYLLHLPGFSARVLASQSAAEARAFFVVDALHVIGLTLLVAELLVLVLRERRRFVVVVGVLGALAVLFAPAMHRVPVETFLHPFVAGYLNDHGGSIFPIFPWSGFLAGGIVTAHFIQRTFDENGAAALAAKLVAASSALLFASLLVHVAAPSLFGEHDIWKTSPLVQAFRLGVVLLVTALFTHLTALRGARRSEPRRHTVAVMGQETLVVYVVHLLVLYGTPLNDGLHLSIGATLSVLEASLVFVGLFVAMAILAWAWHLLKTKRPKEFDRLRLALLAFVLLHVFLS